MNNQHARIGFVWPGGGAEHDFYRFLEETGDRARLYFTCTRVGGDGENDHDVDALEQTSRLDWLVEAALRLVPLNVDCVYWPCTSGSFVRGRAHAEQQLQTLTDTVGALPAALRWHLLKRCVIVASVESVFWQPTLNPHQKLLSLSLGNSISKY